MDRNKPNISRPGKSKIGAPHHGSEIFALGSKAASSSSNSREDSKSKVIASASTSKPVSVNERKREASSNLIPNVAKKPKLANLTGVGSVIHSAGFAVSRPTGESSSSSSSHFVLEYWEQIAQECDPSELAQSVLTAIDRQDSEQVVALLCGAIKLIISRPKLENSQSLSLLYLAKLRPNLFCNDVVTTALLSILRRDATPTFKVRSNPSMHILACNLLARGYHNKTQWPESFVKHYIEDAINERVWVDIDECAAFVDNILTAFGTEIPPKSMLQPELSSVGTSNVISLREDDDSCEGNVLTGGAEQSKIEEKQVLCSVQPRYNHIADVIEKLVIDTVKEQFNRRQAPDCSTRSFLKFLASVSGISDVRAMAITRLELWIHNGKLMKPAQELLTYICYNVKSSCLRDNEVLSNLVKMRLKTKALINIYMNCIREMINLQPDILFIVLKNVVQNELSNARNPNNMGMGMLASIFQTKPDESAMHLATIYQEFLLQREDCLRTLRVFLRELVKMLRYDIKLTVFCEAFLMCDPSIVTQIENFEFRDRVFHAMIDLVCLCMLLSVSPQIREANILMRAGREIKGSNILTEYYDQMSRIQCEAVKWMFQKVPNWFKPSDAEYTQSLHKILLLDAPEQYTKGDQWPPEQERALLLRLVSEIPLHQETIIYLAFIGISKEIPVKIPDAMEIIEQVIRRSAALRINDYPALHADNLKIIDLLFTMAEYHYPENIILPSDYEPPKLAIGTLYWKAWNILLMLSAHNPSSFGAFCWERYPMLRNLMEMSITNQFANLKVPDEELQLNVLEKTQILEFETHLAAATSKVVITESNSLLLSQLILMCPMGVARKPPAVVLEMLQSQNATLKLGHLLCRSRKPDLLLDIIQRQGTSQSMPWLADLVQNSEGEFNHLPVQCLCEFLLSNSSSLDNQRDLELLKYLQNLLANEIDDHQASCEVLEYFLRRLSSPLKQSRANAIKALQLLLRIFHKDGEDIQMDQDDSGWLLHYLPMMPHFPAVRIIVITQLRMACQIENNSDLVMTYIQFIAANTLNDPVKEMLDHVMDLSQLIVERNTLFSCIVPTTNNDENRMQTLNCLFVMFKKYLSELQLHKDEMSFEENSDLVMVHFPDETQQPIHIIIIHAFVILLTYAKMIANVVPILDYWFPPNAPLPKAFAMESHEPIEIFPDWLKLKMIRSSVDRLVDAALHSLSAEHTVLFIQSFGMPINSMSKLLARLDWAVIEQAREVKTAIANDIYFSQLIEIQQARGAKNGHIAIQTLKLDSCVQRDHSKREIFVTETLEVLPFKSHVPVNSSQTKEIEEILETVLHNGSISKTHVLRFRRLVQQFLTTDGHNHLAKQQQNTISKVLQYLNRIAKSQHGKHFYRTILQNSTVCAFFRTLFVSINNKSSNNNYLAGIIDYSIQAMNTEECPMLFQILFNKRKNFIKNEKKTISGVDNQNLIDVIHSSSSIELQMRGSHVLNGLIKNRTRPENLIETITTILQLNQSIKSEIPSKVADNNKHGLLIDWLSDIDSELVLSTKNNMDLLFNRSVPQFRFYLLSLLSHQASWCTLHSVCDKLLQKFNKEYDSTSVVHFVAALIRNPKLWQGREKNTSKHYSIEYVLSLDEQKLKVFIDYILSEDALDADKLSTRINTLLQCVPSELLDLKKIVSYVQNEAQINDDLKSLFMQHLYLYIPPMKFTILNLDDVYMANATKLIHCGTDSITNNIMTCISSLSNTRDFQTMSQHMEMLLRKLAASHPSLTLRQISMLATLLQGRAHMDFSVLRSAHHISLFIQVFGILELLQPYIFEEAYKDSLHLALECYFSLFQIHGTTKDTFDLMYRFMEFLQIYTQKDSINAWKFIEPHTDLIEVLASVNRMIVPLQQLNQGVSLLKYKHSKRNGNDFKSTDKQSNIGSVILTPYTKTLNQTLVKLLNEIQHRTNDEVLSPLQELEIITTKRHVPLESIHERLLSLISSSTVSIRNSAYMLLIRHLKSNPGNLTVNANTLTVYVQCLRKKDTGVVTSALQFLSEMVICLQEYSSEILQNAFVMGIKSKVNTFEHIRKCILALKTQHAC